jgi:hypothetical protein
MLIAILTAGAAFSDYAIAADDESAYGLRTERIALDMEAEDTDEEEGLKESEYEIDKLEAYEQLEEEEIEEEIEEESDN